MWIVLDLVLSLVLLMYCLPTVKSEECNETEIIWGRHGEKLEFNFTFSDIIVEYNKSFTELYGKGVIRHEVQMQDLKTNTMICFKRDDVIKYIIYKNGKQTKIAGKLTKIFMTNNAFVVKITKLQKEDAGIYWIEFRSIPLRQKALIITGKPTIIEQPFLKPEDNYTSTIQRAYPTISTCILDCITMYTVWYRNGMRMTDIDPTLSQNNVNVDHNGGNFTCLTTDYLPCYRRLQTTKQFDDLVNIEECNTVHESETFIVQPEYPPIVKLEPDQREITVNKNDDLVVRCSAKCHPQCEVRWKKEFQVLGSSGSIFITETVFGKDLKIVNISSSHEGFYFCLVNNNHGEVKKNFTLSVTETGEKVVNSVDKNEVVIVSVAVVVVFVIVYAIKYGKCRREHGIGSMPDSPETSTDNNSSTGEQNMDSGNHTYDSVQSNTSKRKRKHSSNSDSKKILNS